MIEPLAPFGIVVRAGRATLADVARSVPAWVEEHRVVVLRGFEPPHGEALPGFASRLGTILEWSFGAVDELRVEPDAKNYLYTSHEVPFHWDGAFVGRIPRYIVFHCVSTPKDSGGETLFCDTERLVAAAEPSIRATWDRTTITYATEALAHYGGRFASPMIGSHPATGATTLRFAEPVVDRNPVTLAIDGITPPDQAAFLADMAARLRDPRWLLAHAWEKDDVLVADNDALLHGRRAFDDAAGAARHIRRVNVLP